jgi:hypothetical protein
VNFIILRAREGAARGGGREIPKMISALLLSHHYYRKIHLDGCSAALLRCDIEADMDTPMAKNKSSGNLLQKQRPIACCCCFYLCISVAHMKALFSCSNCEILLYDFLPDHVRNHLLT